MRALIYVVCLIGAMCGWSCSDHIADSSDLSVQTRTIVSPEGVSTSNPDLISDWEHQSLLTLSTGERINTPWTPGASHSMSEETVSDIKKEDGWTMLFHTFKALNESPNSNYLCFYNELTGVIKVFYYIKNAQGNNGFQWRISTANGVGSSLLALNSYISPLDNSSDKPNCMNLSTFAQTPINGLTPGWNGFEFEVPYTTDYRNISLSINSYNQVITDFNFSGTTELKTEGTITKNVANGGGTTKTAATFTSSGAKKYMDELKKKANGQPSNIAGDVKLGKKIVDALTSGNYFSAIAKGLKFIFGSTTTRPEVSKVSLTTTGVVTMGGTSQSGSHDNVEPLFSINLYDLMNGNLAALKKSPSFNSLVLPVDVTTRSGGERYAGVWTLKESPVIRMTRYGRVLNYNISGGVFTVASVLLPYLDSNVNKKASVILNPYLSQYVTSMQTMVDVVSCAKLNGEKYFNGYAISDFMSEDPIYEDKDLAIRKSAFSGSGGEICNQSISVSDYNIGDGGNQNMYFFDWGTNIKGDEVAVVTVNIAYNYKGKVHNVSISRNYKVQYVHDPATDVKILGTAGTKKVVIVNNYPQFE